MVAGAQHKPALGDDGRTATRAKEVRPEMKATKSKKQQCDRCMKKKPLSEFWGVYKADRRLKRNRCKACVRATWATSERRRVVDGRYNRTAKGAYNSLKQQAKRRGIAVELTLDEYRTKFRHASCFYCGQSPGKTGGRLDRRDHAQAYTSAAIVACFPCNRLRQRKPVRTFKRFMLRSIKAGWRGWDRDGNPQRFLEKQGARQSP